MPFSPAPLTLNPPPSQDPPLRHWPQSLPVAPPTSNLSPPFTISHPSSLLPPRSQLQPLWPSVGTPNFQQKARPPWLLPIHRPAPHSRLRPLRPLPLASSPERWRISAAECRWDSRSGVPAGPADGNEVTVNLRIMVQKGSGQLQYRPDRTSGRSPTLRDRKRGSPSLRPPPPGRGATQGPSARCAGFVQTYLVVAKGGRVVLASCGRGHLHHVGLY